MFSFDYFSRLRFCPFLLLATLFTLFRGLFTIALPSFRLALILCRWEPSPLWLTL